MHHVFSHTHTLIDGIWRKCLILTGCIDRAEIQGPGRGDRHRNRGERALALPCHSHRKYFYLNERVRECVRGQAGWPGPPIPRFGTSLHNADFRMLPLGLHTA